MSGTSQGRIEQYASTFRMSREDWVRGTRQIEPAYADLSIKMLDNLRLQIVDVRKCTLRHPSAKTLTSWLEEVGFSKYFQHTMEGTFARRLYDRVPIDRRPSDIDGQMRC